MRSLTPGTSLACGIIFPTFERHVLCMHVCVQISPFYWHTGHIAVESILLQYDFILIHNIDNDLISLHSRILGH